MRPYLVPLLSGALPLLTIHLCYFLAAIAGDVAWCFPYIESCTSISATGRSGAAFFIFKGLMIPSAMIIAAYWYIASQWLAALASTAHKAQVWMLGIGLAACAGLILYSVMLGAIGDIYRVQRRIGVISFFGFTFIAQQLLVFALTKVHEAERFKREVRTLNSISFVVLSIAISSIVVSAIDSDFYDSVEDAYEWTVTFILCLQPLVVAGLWRRTGFRLEGKVASR